MVLYSGTFILRFSSQKQLFDSSGTPINKGLTSRQAPYTKLNKYLYDSSYLLSLLCLRATATLSVTRNLTLTISSTTIHFYLIINGYNFLVQRYCDFMNCAIPKSRAFHIDTPNYDFRRRLIKSRYMPRANTIGIQTLYLNNIRVRNMN